METVKPQKARVKSKICNKDTTLSPPSLNDSLERNPVTLNKLDHRLEELRGTSDEGHHTSTIIQQFEEGNVRNFLEKSYQITIEGPNIDGGEKESAETR